MSIYRISSYARVAKLANGNVFVGHPFFTNYVFTGDIASVVLEAYERLSSAGDLQVRLSLSAERLQRVLSFLQSEHFLVTDDQDEEAELQEHVRRLGSVGRERNDKNDIAHTGIVHMGKRFRNYAALESHSVADASQPATLPKVKFLIVGGCLTQFAADALLRLAPSFGIEASSEEAFPYLLDAVLMEKPDVVIFQPAIGVFAAPLWGHAAFLDDEERSSRLQMLKDELSLSLGKIRERAPGSLLLVHGFVAPAYSPLGRTEFRSACNFYRIVYELNQVIINAIKNDRNAMFVDEERLLSGEGKLHLMDHAVAPFRHHGPIDLIPDNDPHGPARAATFGVTEPWRAAHLFAQTYLESFVLWKGIGRIKCIIVDLDNTLWPGLVSDADFNLDEATFLWGTLGGIHEALKVAKQRGILLAICSRNDERDVPRAWAQLQSLRANTGAIHFLQPDDFVMQKINWESKSTNVTEIMNALGVSPAEVLFIDDSAIEREEVQTAYPAIRTLGANMNLVRSVLLDDPRLQNDFATAESASRTEMVRAQLKRDAVRKETTDEFAFLRRLDIQLRVTRLRTRARLPRVVELIQRTNQFNTTLLRLGPNELAECIEGPEAATYVLEANDRFTNYGLVGVCVFRAEQILGLVMSCRIIPLRAEVPFLATASIRYGRAPLTGRIVEGPRNQPCRRVFLDAHFAETAPSAYLLPHLSDLAQWDATIYNVEYVDEPGFEDTPAMSVSLPSTAAAGLERLREAHRP